MNELEGIAVLVIDDDEHVGTAIARWLSTRGATVASVKNEHGAAIAVEQRKFDVAIVDVVLVGVSGITVARDLKALYGIAPILITGYGTKDITEEFPALEKPPDFAKLIEAIKKAAGREGESGAKQTA